MFINTQIKSIVGGIGAVLIMILVDDVRRFIKKNYHKYIFLDAKPVIELLVIGGLLGALGTILCAKFLF
jgi:hypothetical protein